jgi:drug/metabolite transporter (DMT)-like permease
VAVLWLLKRNGYFKDLAKLDMEKAGSCMYYRKAQQPLRVNDRTLIRLHTGFPLSILLLVSNYISYKALQFLSLPTYILLSTTTIFTVPYVDSILFGTPIPSFALPSYVLIFSGICISVITENAHAEKSYGDRRLEQTLEPQDPVLALFFGYIFMILHLLMYSTYEAWKTKVVKKLQFGEWDSMFLLTFPRP